MSAFTNYVMIIFGITVVMYFMGYVSPFIELMANIGTDQPIGEQLLNSFLAIFTNPIFLATIGIVGVASFISGGGSFSVTFLIPILMIVAMLNYFVLPTSFILQAGLLMEIKIIVNIFLNLFLALAIVEFVRGS